MLSSGLLQVVSAIALVFVGRLSVPSSAPAFAYPTVHPPIPVSCDCHCSSTCCSERTETQLEQRTYRHSEIALISAGFSGWLFFLVLICGRFCCRQQGGKGKAEYNQGGGVGYGVFHERLILAHVEQ
eukprot:6722336-Karenia_brevis.AAC.1